MHELSNEHAYEHAAYWYQYALDHGNTYVYYPLGLAYQFGYGVEQDCLLAKSAALGNERAKEIWRKTKKG